MNNKISLKLLITLLFINNLVQNINAQVFYTCNVGTIAKVDLSTCQSTVLCNYSSKIYTGDITDIAIGPDGSFYAVTYDGSLYQLYLNDCSYKLLGKFPSYCSSLVCDNTGLIYGGGNDLLVYDPKTNIFKKLGTFNLYGDSSGDYTFRNGKMMMFANPGYFVEINFNKPSSNIFLFNIQPYYYKIGIYGLFTIPTSCDNANTYCVFGNGLVGKVNFISHTIDTICELGSNRTGAASPLEAISSDCALTVDLDLDNSSGVYPYDYKDVNLCNKLERAICDTNDVMVASFNSIDSMTIKLENPLDGGNEFITGDSTSQISITGIGTQYIILLNKAKAKPNDFSNVLKTLRYKNTAINPTPSIRTLRFFAFSNGDTSKPATAFIPISKRISEGIDTTITVCENDKQIDLNKLVTYKVDGKWVPGSGTFNPGADSAGTYKYLFNSQNCGIDTSKINIKLSLSPHIDLGSDRYVNKGDSLILIAGQSYNVSSNYQWTSSAILIKQFENTAQFIINESTKINLIYTDNNGCSTSNDISVLVKEKLSVFIPSAFSPNGDGINDKFTAFADPSKWQVKELSIYDRWGEQIYTQEDFPPSDPTYGWNGKYHNKPVNNGVYVYYCIVKDVYGEEYEMKGDVNVVR